ncbi:2-amino-4-hydroxy-6-hydroxymethyldihydropteridine diphosphokinase [Mangrovimicrobium sediminis]|uniref:2-amino-4-hydroxy-6-hydroxymethyldihydropteridine pyrophosphokinase n=1 Tax=Mangrovimicrobium sediminis TaxID=2562682 RepID=A0A4Z0LUH4_9GAMM|nr:2-amino-4-hydroxy-6-hydroxymethyldihydropteridine diphosphokinase [Haliea sp. SAOS-164]TGD70931.1 2-amino-4-hydroxy-6-hydroxymethyldihydropteridine diphosphokinase [Haliea sp. SAOS-164]
MIDAYIALGSNLAQPLLQLRAAVAALAALPHSELLACSSAYRSAAVGPGEQPDYLNAVAQLRTDLPALALLDALQAIEAARGRVREVRWGARTLDLDLLLYGEQAIDHPRLQVPHPRLSERAFVLYPLGDVAPANLLLPGGEELGKLLAACPRGDLAATDLSLLETPRDTSGTGG